MQESILLAGSTEKGMAMMRSLIPPDSSGVIETCSSGGTLRRALAEKEYGLILINTPLADESGLDLALQLAHDTVSAVILLVKAELADQVASRVEEHGVLVVAKPVMRPLFDQAMRCGLAARNRMLALQAENRRLEKKLAEQRVVDRAKCLLIQYEGYTEEEAHRHLEKVAMNNRTTRISVANDIISRYED